jgi:16S rRNA C1402 (ribose-2'-O) methylase RsmI
LKKIKTKKNLKKEESKSLLKKVKTKKKNQTSFEKKHRLKKNLNFIKKNLKIPLLITQRNIVKYNHTTSYGGFYANKSNVFNW